jgi:hypothetical protein
VREVKGGGELPRDLLVVGAPLSHYHW